MSGHTPGPWKQYPILSGSENDKGFHVTAARVWIAEVSPVIKNERGDASEEGKANAALIVAAPDLLAAVKAALAWPDEDETGEPWDEQYTTPAYRAYRKQLRDAISKAECK